MSEEERISPDPHRGQPIRMAGEPLENARAAMILVHGREASAGDILSLADALEQPGFAYLAPEAADNIWYPRRFLEPFEENEPWLSSALAVVKTVLKKVSDAGIGPERTMLLGFSQGASLSLEFVARNARRYGGVVGLSGGIIGTEDAPRFDSGLLGGTPIFLGCSDVDPFIPKERVLYSARVLRALGGDVTAVLYPNMRHEVVQDEIDVIRGMMKTLLSTL